MDGVRWGEERVDIFTELGVIDVGNQGLQMMESDGKESLMGSNQ